MNNLKNIFDRVNIDWKSISKVVSTSFLVSLLVATVYIAGFKTFFSQRAAEPISTEASNLSVEEIEKKIKEDTSKTLNFDIKTSQVSVESLAKESPSKILDAKISSAVNRKNLMSTLIEKDTHKFLELAVPEKVIKNFDQRIKDNFEKEVQTSGVLENIHFDNFDKKEIRSEFYLKSGGKRIRLYFTNEDVEHLPSGEKLEIKGYQVDGKIAVSHFSSSNKISPHEVFNLASPDQGVSEPVQKPTPTPLPTKRIAVVLFNFADRREEPWTVDDIKKWTFTEPNSVAAYYKEVSFGKLNFTGDVYGWLNLSMSAGTGCPSYDASIEAKNQLMAKGVNLDSYDNVIYAFPSMNCWAPAWAEIVGKQSWINGTYNLYSQPFPSASLANTNVGMVIHELGHNLGMNHASSYSCHDSNGKSVSLDKPSNCSRSEYGDPFDVMGYDYFYSRQLNGFHKGQIGLFLPTNKAQVTKTGNYNIFPIERNLPNNIQSLRIPAGIDPLTGKKIFYYLEYRQQFGKFDNFNSKDPAVNGVGVRIAPGYVEHLSQSHLIDTTPEVSGYENSALGLNKVFNDTYRGIKIKVTALTRQFATINFTKYTPPCVRSKPEVSLEPIAQWGKPGETLYYSMSIANTDSFSCGTSTFTVTPVLFSGWTQTPSATTVSVGPWSKSYVTLAIKSNNQNPTGYFTFREGIKHNLAPQLSTAISANYNVYYSDTTPPITKFVSPTDNQTVSAGYNRIEVEVNDNTQVSYVYLTQDGIYVDGFSAGPFIFNTTFQPGNHILKVSAYDFVGNYSEASININIVSPSPSPTSSVNPSPTSLPTISPSITPNPTTTASPTSRPTSTSNPTAKPTATP